MHLGVMLAALVLWQAHAAWLAWEVVPQFGALLEGLGAELPLPARFVLSTYRAWAVIPVAMAVFGIDLLRRDPASLLHATIVLLSGAIAAVLMRAGLLDAMLLPFLDVLRQVA